MASHPGNRWYFDFISSFSYLQWPKVRAANVPLHFPPAHPFSPLAALRLYIAAGNAPGC